MAVTLRDIREDDLENVMRWRMAPEITRYMNTDPVLTLEGQKKWLASIQANSDVKYWIIEIDGMPAGVVNIVGLDREDGKMTWAYYVGEKSLRSFKTALNLEMSMYEHVLVKLNRASVMSDVFSLNKGVIALHEYCGCEVFQGKYDAVHGDEKFMYGIHTVMSFIAFEAGDYDFEDSFMDNMIECEERARNNE